MNREFLHTELHGQRDPVFAWRGLADFDFADDRLKSILGELKVVGSERYIKHAELSPFIGLHAAHLPGAVANFNNGFRQGFTIRMSEDATDRPHPQRFLNRVEKVLSRRLDETCERSGFKPLWSLGGEERNN